MLDAIIHFNGLINSNGSAPEPCVENVSYAMYVPRLTVKEESYD